ARDCLLKYDWPGNIRELRNALEQAVILGDGKKITPNDLPPHIARPAAAEWSSSRNHWARSRSSTSSECSKRRVAIKRRPRRFSGSRARRSTESSSSINPGDDIDGDAGSSSTRPSRSKPRTAGAH